MDGRQALERVHERTYALIVSDVRMPDVDGPALYRESCGWPARRSTRRMVFVTGDIVSPETRRFLDETCLRYLEPSRSPSIEFQTVVRSLRERRPLPESRAPARREAGRDGLLEALVAQAVGAVGLGAEPLLPVGLVVGVAPLGPDRLALVLEGEDVGRDAVEEPPVVADHDDAAREASGARPRARAACRRRGRSSARRAGAGCRPRFRSFARCTRFRSPPERSPIRFCWSAPFRLNEAT